MDEDAVHRSGRDDEIFCWVDDERFCGVRGRAGRLGFGGGYGIFADFDQGLEGVAQGVVLHGDEALVVEVGEEAEDLVVADLAGAGLVAAGDVGDVDEAYEIDVVLELFEEVSGLSLLVVDVVEDLEAGASDLAADVEGLGDAGEVDGGVFEGVDGLDDDIFVGALGEGKDALEVVDADLGGGALEALAGGEEELGTAELVGGGDGVGHAGFEVFDALGIGEGDAGAGHGVDGEMGGLDLGDDAGVVGVGPFGPFADELDALIAGFGGDGETVFEGWGGLREGAEHEGEAEGDSVGCLGPGVDGKEGGGGCGEGGVGELAAAEHWGEL